MAPALALIRDGKLRALAAGSPKRSSLFPDLPTTIEAGYPDSDYNFWIGLFVPARTPRDIVNRLHKESVAAVQAPEVKDRFARLGAEPLSMTPEGFEAYVKDELRTNAVLVKEVGLTGS